MKASEGIVITDVNENYQRASSRDSKAQKANHTKAFVRQNLAPVLSYKSHKNRSSLLMPKIDYSECIRDVMIVKRDSKETI